MVSTCAAKLAHNAQPYIHNYAYAKTTLIFHSKNNTKFLFFTNNSLNDYVNFDQKHETGFINVTVIASESPLALGPTFLPVHKKWNCCTKHHTNLIH